MAKEGSTVSGLMDSFATAVSLALQHGVPLRVLCEKFAHTRFEPSGWTGNEQIGYAKSIMDYIFRWIQIRFLSGHQLDLFAGLTPQHTVPVEGSVNAPGNRVVPSLNANSDESVIPSEARESPHFVRSAGPLRLRRTPTPPHPHSRESPPTRPTPLLSSRRSAAEGSRSPWKTAASTTPPLP